MNKKVVDRIKTYKNSVTQTENEDRKQYVPQYQLLGVQPEEYKSTGVNPRVRQPSIRTTTVLPNVGNKMEHTWSGVDGDTISEGSDEYLDPNHPMIDNNEFIDAADNFYVPESEEPLNVPNNDYMLFIDNIFFISGSLEEIEKEVRLLVFGEHKLCEGEPVSPEMLSVYKRVSVKVGVFLE